QKALAKTIGVLVPGASQDLDGQITIDLGAKGVVELELVSSGEKWGRGPTKDIHSSLRANVDSPAFHLVQALNTLLTADGTGPAIDGFADPVRPLSKAQLAMLDEAVKKRDEATMKKQLSITHWLHDEPFRDAMIRLVSRPTVNIEGLVGGYTGPGGK